LDIGPSFPASVAFYLKRTRSGNKLNVTFDYDSGLFVPIEDGEFVLIRNSTEDGQPILLPRSARFATKRQFYEFYGDYYHCADPRVGEVQIIQPVTVESVAGGWKLKTPGILEVLEEQRKKKVPAHVTGHQADTSTLTTAQPPIEATKKEWPLTPCAHCGSFVETRYAFCWDCGHPLESSVASSEETKEMMASAAVAREEEGPPAAHFSGPSILSLALEKIPHRFTPERATTMKLIALGLVGSLFVLLGVIVTQRWVLNSTPTTAPVTAQAQLNPGPQPGREGKRNTPIQPAQARTSASTPEDDELKKLRDSVRAAGAVPGPDVLKAFRKAEERYPNDYRFPYERAKLAAKVDQTHTHDEAFAALSLAVRKAIESGKASEMLDSMEADKHGDLNKLSRGHDEWTRLEQTLKSQNKNRQFAE
jgi:hypothetical protein